MTSHRGKHPSGPSVTASIQTGEMAGNPEAMPVSASQDQDARTSSDSQASAPASPTEDFRVRCTLKRAVSEVMEQCGRFVQELGAALPEDVRELALRDAQWVGTGPAQPGPDPAPHRASANRMLSELGWDVSGKAARCQCRPGASCPLDIQGKRARV